jgi:hypothetical protein
MKQDFWSKGLLCGLDATIVIENSHGNYFILPFLYVCDRRGYNCFFVLGQSFLLVIIIIIIIHFIMY